MNLHQYQSLLQRNFLLFLKEWYFLSSLDLFFFSSSFFLFFFFYQGLSTASDFFMSKDFFISKEILCVNFVKCMM